MIMTRHTALFSLLLFLLASSSAHAQRRPPAIEGTATARERAAIISVLTDYVEGISSSDTLALRRAFHPAARLQGMREGVYYERSLPTWTAAIALRKPSPLRMAIRSIDVTQTAAAVRLDLFAEDGTLAYTDYLSLLQEAGRWYIVNKIYHTHD